MKNQIQPTRRRICWGRVEIARQSRFYLVALLLCPVFLYCYLTRYNGVLKISEMIASGRYSPAAIWIVFYVLCFITFLLLLTLLRRWRLYLFLVLCSLSFLTNILYNSITGRRIDPDVVAWLLDQNATFQNAFAEFQGAFVQHSLLVLGAMALLLAWRSALFRTLTFRSIGSKQMLLWRVGAVIAFMCLHLACLFARPDYLAAEVNVPLMAIAGYLDPEPEPGAVTGNPVGTNDIQKVLLVVDESVRADYFKKLVSDSLKELPHLDYGEAAATVNCSAGTNALLRWGIDQNRLGTKDYDPRNATYIWSYAKAAGYKTVLIDGQASNGNPQNFLGRKERRLIDEQVIVKDSPEADLEIARELRNRFLNNSKEFIYIVKRGVHFPFDFSYAKGYLPEQATRLEKYEAGIHYTTSRFFREISIGIDYSHIFAVYTSDHGIVLEEGKQPNCNHVPSWQEYSVPLMVVTKSEHITQKLSANLDVVRNHASHEQIFPTLLYAMGYSLTMDTPRYALPLYDRWDRYTVLLSPYVPVVGRNYHKGVAFEVFDHFPYRAPSQ
jgi:glucan phosphoethanolaminetransferase (alkaline phosphatase superfamily)